MSREKIERDSAWLPPSTSAISVASAKNCHATPACSL